VRFLRVQETQVDRVRAWFGELQSRRSEVLETFAQEGTRSESAHLLQGEEGPILVYVMEVDNPEEAARAYAESTLPIDAEHKAIMASCLAGRAASEILFECSATQ
jgi:hypothetical protein